MTFVALAVVLMLAGIGLGARGSAERAWVAPCMALAIVVAQLALVMFG